ncbi:MAG: hypothetical protein U0939_09875 [Pirellulales bacterium]
MPAKRRREIMDPTRVGAYHCYSRCVRRAFLAGIDLETGRDFSHRKDWVRQRLEALASVFAIDVLDHAVMENHVHSILRNRPDVARAWTKREVAERWLRLSRKRLALLDPPDREQVEELLKTKGRVDVLRKRLSNISWFMIMLNEPLALRANLEDEMSGHFWAERFGSMRLENDESLLVCSLYVDLNPIRAGRRRRRRRRSLRGLRSAAGFAAGAAGAAAAEAGDAAAGAGRGAGRTGAGCAAGVAAEEAAVGVAVAGARGGGRVCGGGGGAGARRTRVTCR